MALSILFLAGRIVELNLRRNLVDTSSIVPNGLPRSFYSVKLRIRDPSRVRRQLSDFPLNIIFAILSCDIRIDQLSEVCCIEYAYQYSLFYILENGFLVSRNKL